MKRFTILVVTFVFFTFSGSSLPIKVFAVKSAEAATKAQWRYAKRACRKKYGNRLIKTTINKRGKIICRYRTTNRRVDTNSTYAEVVKICRKQYKGNVTINAYRKFGKWYCSWRE